MKKLIKEIKTIPTALKNDQFTLTQFIVVVACTFGLAIAIIRTAETLLS
jgi:hypothetical protein